METIRKALNQIKDVWERAGRGNRVAMVALTLFSLAAIAGVGIWSSQPQYIPLASGMTPGDTMKVASLLQAEGIPYELNPAGSAISVPKSQWAEARLAAGDTIPDDLAPLPNEEFSPMDPAEALRIKERRNAENKLARTLSRINGIKNAFVHISQQERTPFMRASEQASASVMLELQEGQFFSRQNAMVVVETVSHAVPGLPRENVAVTSTKGEDLLNQGMALEADAGKRLAYLQRIEAAKATAAEVLLASTLGPGRARIQVSADIDFQKVTRTKVTFDPDGKVAETESINSQSTKGGVKGGIAGATANLAIANPAVQGGSETIETVDARYLVPKTEEVIELQPGSIKRLTVAALVDLSIPPVEPPAEGEPEPPAIKRPTLDDIKSLIKQATGALDADITVVEATFADPFTGTPVETTGAWNQYRDMFQTFSLGLGALVAVVFGFLTLRRLKPITLPPDTAEAEGKRDRLVAEISEEAEKHPETISQIVATWLNEPLPQTEPPATDEAAENADEPLRAAA